MTRTEKKIELPEMSKKGKITLFVTYIAQKLSVSQGRRGKTEGKRGRRRRRKAEMADDIKN